LPEGRQRATLRFVSVSGLPRRGWAAAAFALVAAASCGNELGRLSATRVGDLAHGNLERAAFDVRQAAACGSGGLTADGARALLRRPYLQKMTARSAEVLFTADSAQPPTVRLTRPDGSRVATVAARPDRSARLRRGQQFVAAFGDLEPARIYCYEIESGGAIWSRRTGFRTAPLPGVGAAATFVAVGDLGWRSGDQRAVLEQMMTVEFDFAVVTGDLAYPRGRLAELERKLFAVYAPIMRSVPFFVAAGNHDYKTKSGAPLRRSFSLFENGGAAGRERWYSFDWGDVHVVVLDTERMNRAQQAWLERDLERNRLPWTVVVAHRPPYSSGKHGSDLRVRERFVPLFERHRVALVLHGHEHSYERTLPINGVTYVITGGGGRGTRPVGASYFTAFSLQVAHFVVVRVEAEALRVVAIDALGREFDSAVIARPRVR